VFRHRMSRLDMQYCSHDRVSNGLILASTLKQYIQSRFDWNRSNMMDSIKIKKAGLQQPCGNNAVKWSIRIVISAFIGVILTVTGFSDSSVQKNGPRSEAMPTPARICHSDNEKAWVSVSGFAHLLLFYGRGPTDLPSFTSGDLMVKALTDEQTAILAFGKSPFVQTRNGLRYFLYDDPTFHTDVGEVHRDQCLATFADLNMSLEIPIHLKSGNYTISNLLSESVANFSLDQREPAWTAMAYVKYLAPQKEWVNRFGERTSFSQLVKHLFLVDLNSQSCAGIHIFEALVRIYNADEHYAILDNETRKQLNSYLKATIHEIVQNQQADGGWKKQWCASVNDDIGKMTPIEARLLVTGHLLQILNELDSQWRPTNMVYVRAAEWIKQVLNSPNTHYDVFWLCPFTHGVLNARSILMHYPKDDLNFVNSFHNTE